MPNALEMTYHAITVATTECFDVARHLEDVDALLIHARHLGGLIADLQAAQDVALRRADLVVRGAAGGVTGSATVSGVTVSWDPRSSTVSGVARRGPLDEKAGA